MSVRIFVTSSNDSGPGTLRKAIEQSNLLPKSLIILKPSVGHKINLQSELLVSSNVKIINNTQSDLTITSSERIFHVTAPSQLFELWSPCQRIILREGSAENGGAIYVETSDHHLKLDNTILKDNRATTSGGAIYTLGKLSMKFSLVAENVAGFQGGGLWVGRGLSLEKTGILKNAIIRDGAGAGVFVDDGNVMLKLTSISHNLAPKGSGGGIVIMVGSFVMEHSHVDHNKAYNAGGIQEGQGNIYMINSTANHNRSFNDNRGSAGGGGITISLGSVYLTESEISENKTVGMFSGGIVSLVGDVFVFNSKVSGNTNRGPGGGIAMNFGNVLIEGSTITGNTGASLGGGLVNFAPAPGYIQIFNSEIKNNVLTNAETINQTIESFLEVLIDYLGSVEKQSSGSGGQKFSNSIPEIIAKLKVVAELLEKLGIGPRIGGGGIATLLSTKVTVQQSKILENFAGAVVSDDNTPFEALGGGLFTPNATTFIQESKILKNRALSRGGGIHNTGNLTLIKSQVIENQAKHAGGVYSNDKFLSLETLIKNNTPDNVVIG